MKQGRLYVRTCSISLAGIQPEKEDLSRADKPSQHTCVTMHWVLTYSSWFEAASEHGESGPFSRLDLPRSRLPQQLTSLKCIIQH